MKDISSPSPLRSTYASSNLGHKLAWMKRDAAVSSVSVEDQCLLHPLLGLDRRPPDGTSRMKKRPSYLQPFRVILLALRAEK